MCISSLILVAVTVLAPTTDGFDSGDPGIGTLVPGTGFSGETSPPPPVGSALSPGFGAKAIARWTEFPFVNRTEDFHVTLSAYHMTGIDRVEFSLEGGEPLVVHEIQPHPESGYAEYLARIDVSDLDSGIHEIRAVIYPNHGMPRVLQGSHDDSNLHMLNNGNQSFWFNHQPNPTMVRVGADAEFSSIDEAVEFLGSEITSGQIELEAGEYTWFTRSHSDIDNTLQNRVLTISAAPGVERTDVVIRPHTTNPQGARSLSIHLKGVTLIAEEIPNNGNTNGVMLLGSGFRNNRLFLEDILCTSGEGYPDGWGSADLPTVTKVLTNWLGGLWAKHVDFVNIPKGISTVYLAKHTTVDRVSRDIWGQSPGAIIDCTIDRRDHCHAEHEDHADIIQFFVLGDFIENRIFADITSTNDYSQIGHLEWSTKLSNFAFVRWTVDAQYPSQSLNFLPEFDHLVMVDCTFRGASVDFMNKVRHGLLRNLVTYKFRGEAASDVFDESTLITENVHFCTPREDSPSWATYGELDWAAPSPPVGISSDGSGGFINTLVQQPIEITNWKLGNRSPHGSSGHGSQHHFYYDASLLNLSHGEGGVEYHVADLNSDGVVDRIDLVKLLQSFGTSQNDLTGDGLVDGKDLALMLGSWS